MQKLFKNIFDFFSNISKLVLPKNKSRNDTSETNNCSADLAISIPTSNPNPPSIINNEDGAFNGPEGDQVLIAWKNYYKTNDPLSTRYTEEETPIQKTECKPPIVPLTPIEENEITIRKYLCSLYSVEKIMKNGAEADTTIDENVFVFKGKVFIFKKHYEFDIKKTDLEKDFYEGLAKFEESFGDPLYNLLNSNYTNLKIISQEKLHNCKEFTEDQKQTLKAFSSKSPHEKDQPMLHPIYAIRVDNLYTIEDGVDNLDKKQPSRQLTRPRVAEPEATTTISSISWNQSRKTNSDRC